MQFFRKQIRLNLALQGGGAHGAFTWGVLDRLLDDERLDFGMISAASAGSVNAVAMASGLANGGRAEAKKSLRAVWEAVNKAGVPDLMRLNPFLFGLSRSGPMAQVASLMSPYDFNPLGFDPLRELLKSLIDFEALRTKSGPELLLAATEVKTGRARLFRRKELTVEAVLASACLPTLHHAVEIDGAAYWDGGFSANPDLVNLALESRVRDTLLVQISPLEAERVPTGVREITAHTNRLTFNAPLLRDIEVIETVREASHGLLGHWRGRLSPLARHRFHLIDAGRHTGSLSPESNMKPDWGLLTYLHGAGRTEAEKWLAQHRRDVGVRESVSLAERFLGRGRIEETPPVPVVEEPAVVIPARTKALG